MPDSQGSGTTTLKFLNQLTEALRNIPKDLPGEDEWGISNHPIDSALRGVSNAISMLDSKIIDLVRVGDDELADESMKIKDMFCELQITFSKATDITSLVYYWTKLIERDPTPNQEQHFEELKIRFEKLKNTFKEAVAEGLLDDECPEHRTSLPHDDAMCLKL